MMRSRTLVYLLASCLLAVLFSGTAQAGYANVAWEQSPSADVTGYRVYASTVAGSYIDSYDAGNVTATTVPNLTDGQTYYFVTVAYDASGNQSSYSNEVSGTLPGGLPTSYIIVVSARAGGSVSPSGPRAVESGGSLQVTATPAGENIFREWVDGAGALVSTDNPFTKSDIAADGALTGLFWAPAETPSTAGSVKRGGYGSGIYAR